MNVIALVVVITSIVVFGPEFLVQAFFGYLIGTLCGLFAADQIRKLHCAICEYTHDDQGDIDSLAKYVIGASRIGGILCPIIPLISVGIGIYCRFRRQRLGEILTHSDTGARSTVSSNLGGDVRL